MPTQLALITGGSRGLGRAAAVSLAARGVDVIITYNSRADAADSLVREVQSRGRRATALQLNTGNVAAFPRFVSELRSALEHFGRTNFDHLVNNAGHGVYAPFAETTVEQFDDLLDVHLKGPFFLTQQLLPLIAEGGSILNVSSGLTRFSSPGYVTYASMKGAIEVLTRYQAMELGPRKIRVNTLAPGAIETDFGGGGVRDNPQVNSAIAQRTALGRVGLPEDIGDVIAALLSDDARWINGQRIEAAGGANL